MSLHEGKVDLARVEFGDNVGIVQEMKSEEGLEGLKGKKLKFHILEVNPVSSSAWSQF